MNNYTVYCHENRINGKRYVGITHLSPRRRWNNGRGYKLNSHFTSAINKYGWEEFDHHILYEGLSKEEACEKEKYLIQKWNLCDPEYGYNNTYGGEHGLMSEHTRKKMSEAQKGEKAFWYGKKLPEDAKHKMSEVKKGKIPKSTPPKKVYCFETDTTYASMTDASRILNISTATVYKSCNNNYKRKPRLHFVYVEEKI